MANIRFLRQFERLMLLYSTLRRGRLPIRHNLELPCASSRRLWEMNAFGQANRLIFLVGSLRPGKPNGGTVRPRRSRCSGEHLPSRFVQLPAQFEPC